MSGDAEYPALGFNPAPGNVGGVNALVDQLNSASNAMENAHNTLTSLASGSGSWQGDAANAFSKKVGELPKHLQQGVDALKGASTQLASWSSTLAHYQDTAKRYEADAEELKSRIQEAEARKGEATSRYDQAAGDPALQLIGTYQANAQALEAADQQIMEASNRLHVADGELQAAKAELHQLEEELHHLVKQAKELLHHHHDDAEKTAKALRKADHNLPHKSMWSKIGDGFKKIGQGIKNWAHKHADLLKKIGDVAGACSAVLGIAALATMWCPPLSAALGGAAAGASAVALGAHGLAKLGGANISAMTLVMDGVGALPGVGSAFKAAKGVTIGLKAAGEAAEGANALSKAAEGVGLARETVKGTKAVTEAAKEGSLLHKGLSAVVTRTPLAKLPGMTVQTVEKVKGGWAMVDEAGKIATKDVLDPMSWWSRGTQIGIKGIGLGLHAPELKNELSGSPA
ncbi:putative T7SS-secreted protein [Kitasatospora sp. GP82]|uniref:putative T7SS-secreted protein n=1 Tax=Kitasatospora sp. GP82 TaxID=3035089 RepID=UPI002475CC21|nr:hypothetical protein [Kitasatospora sp. GP82]MDH6128517.1 uncharacterized protein YukE/ElaB/YqjD/DUF883 family membrane-anchored ribosome-binding protein [Kitasatospora sp. GP82]